jgi:hypothetical protein
MSLTFSATFSANPRNDIKERGLFFRLSTGYKKGVLIHFFSNFPTIYQTTPSK